MNTQIEPTIGITYRSGHNVPRREELFVISKRLTILIFVMMVPISAVAWPWDSLAKRAMNTKQCDYGGAEDLPNTSGKVTNGGRIVVELSPLDDEHVEIRLVHMERQPTLVAKVVEGDGDSFQFWLIQGHLDSPVLECSD